MDYKKMLQVWLNDPNIDAKTKDELNAITDEKELEDRFYMDLEFGTAGLRGVIGAGTNRMNKYTVGKASQGLSNFILEHKRADMGVCIAYDSRNMSPEFADFAASVLNANGIKAYVFDELRPTPELSFAVRYLKATAGIVITASHNPKEYNGYKVYWDDGAQISDPFDIQIMDAVKAVTEVSMIKFSDKEAAIKDGLYITVGKEIDDEYIKNVTAQVQDQTALTANANGLKVVYTPLNGTGNKLVRRALKEVGFDNVFVVAEQEAPDPNFTTVGYPNPEDPKVFALGIDMAKKMDADIVVATDPDADRVGAVVKNDKGEYVILTGNMSGLMVTHFILDTKKRLGTMPKNGAVIKTIVTTEMVRPICDEYGVELLDVLTGFKFIGGKIKEWETTNEHEYLFGFEESYGCLCGTYARDKDAIVATMLVCEMAAHLKSQGKSLYDGLLDLYEKYGYYKEEVISVSLKGADGLKAMAKMMADFRENPPVSFAGSTVVAINDFKAKKRTVVADKKEFDIDLPASNVLKYELEGGAWVCVRPSGTEPKIKFYIGVKGESLADADVKVAAIKKELER